MKKVLAIGGIPGTGKSTLIRRLMEDLGDWERIKPIKLLDCEYNKDNNIAIFGKYDEDEVFPGTDKLSMAVQPEATKFLSETYDGNFIFEGDRLYNGSFLHAIEAMDDLDFLIIYLTATDGILQQRYKERGSDQSEKFITGRKTKCERILTSFALMPYIEEYPNHNPIEQQIVLDRIYEFFGVEK